MIGKNLSFPRPDYRGKLIQIADKNHLHAAERLVFIGAELTQKNIYTIQQICAQHGRFVNNQGLQMLIYPGSARFKLAALDLSGTDINRETEKTVNRLPFNIKSGHSGRCQENDPLGAVRIGIVQQS